MQPDTVVQPDLATQPSTAAPPAVEAAVRSHLVAVLAADVEPGEIDPTVDLAGAYGLTSLNKVLFLTALCQDTGVDMAHLTEDDLATMHTLRDCVEILSRHVATEV